MHVHHFRVIAVVVACAAVFGCGGTTSRSNTTLSTVTTQATPEPARYVALGFQPDPARGVVLAIAPVPMTGDLAGRIDIGLDRSFADTPRFQLRIPSAQLRTRMNGDHQLVLLVSRITKLEDDWKPGTAAPGLDSFMEAHDVARLREVLMEADVLMVPGIFEFRDDGKTTAGNFTARVYDLRTGRLLLRDTFRNSMPAGPNARVAVAMEMILTANTRIAADLLPNPR